MWRKLRDKPKMKLGGLGGNRYKTRGGEKVLVGAGLKSQIVPLIGDKRKNCNEIFMPRR